MRMRTISLSVGLMSLAACAAISGAAHAYTLTCPDYGYRCYRTPSPDEAAKKAYDRAWVYHRVHGAWPDGRERAAWQRGQVLPLGVARNAPAVDWRAANLYAPRSGYSWRDVGGDFLLVSDVSRLIDQVVLSSGRSYVIAVSTEGELIGGGNPAVAQSVQRLKPSPERGRDAQASKRYVRRLR